MINSQCSTFPLQECSSAVPFDFQTDMIKIADSVCAFWWLQQWLLLKGRHYARPITMIMSVCFFLFFSSSVVKLASPLQPHCHLLCPRLFGCETKVKMWGFQIIFPGMEDHNNAARLLLQPSKHESAACREDVEFRPLVKTTPFAGEDDLLGDLIAGEMDGGSSFAGERGCLTRG